MFGFIKKIFIGLLIGLGHGYDHTKCVSLSNHKCMIQPTFIDLHPNNYRQDFHYYTIVVKLDRCAGSCNILNDLSNQICIQIKQD